MNMLRVSCAVLIREGKVLCAQRNENMSLPLKWEFPGGKIEHTESPEEALLREIREELNISVKIEKELKSTQHEYPSGKRIELIPFIVSVVGGKLTIKEHKQVIWKEIQQLHALDWAEADIPIVKELQKEFG